MFGCGRLPFFNSIGGIAFGSRIRNNCGSLRSGSRLSARFRRRLASGNGLFLPDRAGRAAFARSGRRSATSQPIRAQYVLPVIREAAKSALWALTFQDCPAYYQTLRSIGTTEDVAQWSAYLHCNFNNAAEAGKDTPYYAPLQKLAYRALGVLRCVYAVLLPLAFVWAVVRHLCALPMVLRRRTAGAALPWLLLFGLLAMAALRCGMIAFVEVSSFGIGTSTMYLSTVHPLLLLYTYGCLICYRNKGVITE